MTHLVPYARQGLAGYALSRHHESGTPGAAGLVHTRRCPADVFTASVYADRSVVVGRVGTTNPYPAALSFQGYLSPEHRGEDDGRRVDPSIAAVLSYGSFWDEVAQLCARAPRLVDSPDLATDGGVFPDWMPYDGRQHAGYQAAMELAFATAQPFWTGPHVPTEIWVHSLPAPGERPTSTELRIGGMRSDGLPLSLQEMAGGFARVFMAALDVQTFWPPCCRLRRWWHSVHLDTNTLGKAMVSGLLEWNVPKRTGHAWMALLAQHQDLSQQALARAHATA